MQCEALKKNGHPCRNWARPNHLCYAHRNFFKDERPYLFVLSHSTIFQTPNQRKWMIRMLRSPLFEWKHIFTEDLERSASEMVLLGPRRRQMNYSTSIKLHAYDLFVQAGVISPTEVLPFWKRKIREQLDVLKFCYKEVRVPKANRDYAFEILKPYLTGVATDSTLIHILKCFHARVPSPPLTLGDPELDALLAALPPSPPPPLDYERDVLTFAMDTLPIPHYLAANLDDFIKRLDFIFENDTKTMWNQPGFRDMVLSLLKGKQQEHRAAIREHIKDIKQELIQTTFHPDRIAAAIDSGLEVEDL